MKPLLVDRLVEEYHVSGFVQGGALVSADVADGLLREIEQLIADESGSPAGSFFEMGVGGRSLLHRKNMWETSSGFRDLLHQPAIAEALHALTGGDRFTLWQDGLFYKPSRTGSAHAWHQDLTYLPVTQGSTGTAVWLALTDVLGVANGAMTMVRGSHRWGDHADLVEGLGLPGAGVLPAAFGGHPVEAETCVVPKGSVHFHDGYTWHASFDNRHSEARCGLLLFFLDEGARLDSSHRYAERYAEARAGEFDRSLHPTITFTP